MNNPAYIKDNLGDNLQKGEYVACFIDENLNLRQLLLATVYYSQIGPISL